MKEKIDMKKKIEKILTVVWEDNNSWESEGSKETIKKALDELSTLIQEERKEAVEGLLNKCCKECRDLVYSEYALQEQDKKTNGVEKMVREEQGK